MKKFKKRIIGFLVAIVLIAIIALGAAMFVGCTDFHIHTKAKEGQIKVACVGDSITYGSLPIL